MTRQRKTAYIVGSTQRGLMPAADKSPARLTTSKYYKVELLCYILFLIALCFIIRRFFFNAKNDSKEDILGSFPAESRLFMEHYISEPTDLAALSYSARVVQLASPISDEKMPPEKMLDHVKVIFHDNGATPAYGDSTHDERRLTQFKASLANSLKQASAITRRFVRDVLFHPDSQITLYTTSPTKSIGQVVPANQAIRYYQGNNPKGDDLRHEFMHMGAALMSFPNMRSLPALSLIPETGDILANGMLAQSFPCQIDNSFYEIWQSELEENILPFSDMVLQRRKNDPSYANFIAKVASYAPEFSILLSTLDLQHLEQIGLAIGQTFNFKSKAFSKRINILPDEANPLFEDSKLKAYILQSLKDTNLKIMAINDNTGLTAHSVITVTPLEIKLEVKAMHFIYRMKHLAAHANSMKPMKAHCQEAFACLFQLDSKIIETFFPKSLAYVEQKLNDDATLSYQRTM